MSKRGRLTAIAGALLALPVAALAVVALLLSGNLGTAHHAQAGNPLAGIELHIGIDTNGDTTDDCFTGTPGGPNDVKGNCAIAQDSKFFVNAYLDSFPAAQFSLGYAGLAVQLTYTGVTAPVASVAAAAGTKDMNIWPPCVFEVSAGGGAPPTFTNVGCTIGISAANSFYLGKISKNTFTCTADGTITMQHSAAATGVIDPALAQHSEAGPDVLNIDCQNATPTFTPTTTPTPTNTPLFTPTPTPNPNPRMRLDAAGITCVEDLTVPGHRRCDAQLFAGAAKRAEFTLRVTAFHDISQITYGGFKTQIDLDDGLTYNARTCGTEVVWDQGEVTCANPAVGKSVRHNVRTSAGPPFTASTFVGTLVELKVHCAKPGDHQITLKFPGGSNPGTAYFSTTNTEIPVKVENSPDIDVATVRCAAQTPEMSLDASGPRVACTPGPSNKPLKCSVPFEPGAAQTPFNVSVLANVIPANETPSLDGYGGFDTEVLFGGLAYVIPKPSCLQEAIWPDVLLCAQSPATITTFKQHQLRSAIFPSYPASHYAGELVRMSVKCPNLGQFQVTLPAHSTLRDKGAVFYRPDGSSVPVATATAGLLDANGDTIPDPGTTPAPIVDALLINCQIIPTATVTFTPTSTATPTATPCAPCPTATFTASATATATNTAPPTNTPTITPTRTATSPPTNTPTITPTATPCCEAINVVLFGRGKVSTDDGENDGATAADQVETSVTITAITGGKVSIDEKPMNQPDPPGYHFFGQQVNISAAGAQNASDPLVIAFTLDASIIPSGENQNTLQIFRNGSAVPNCSGPSGVASPDPCVSKRNLLVGPAAGDILLTVLATDASTWNFADPTGTPGGVRGDVNCNGHVNPIDAQFILQLDAGMIHSVPCPQNADVNHSGSITPSDAALILQLSAGIIHDLPAGASG